MGEEEKKPGEEYKDWKAPETGGQSTTGKPESRFLMGAEVRPDGSLDLSQAVEFTDPKKNAELRAQQQKNMEAERKELFESPPPGEPGSQQMVEHKLRQNIFAVTESLGRAHEAGSAPRTIRSKEALLQTYKRALELYDQSWHRHRGGGSSAESLRDYLDDDVIGDWERDENLEAHKYDLIAAKTLRKIADEEAERGRLANL